MISISTLYDQLSIEVENGKYNLKTFEQIKELCQEDRINLIDKVLDQKRSKQLIRFVKYLIKQKHWDLFQITFTNYKKNNYGYCTWYEIDWNSIPQSVVINCCYSDLALKDIPHELICKLTANEELINLLHVIDIQKPYKVFEEQYEEDQWREILVNRIKHPLQDDTAFTLLLQMKKHNLVEVKNILYVLYNLSNFKSQGSWGLSSYYSWTKSLLIIWDYFYELDQIDTLINFLLKTYRTAANRNFFIFLVAITAVSGKLDKYSNEIFDNYFIENFVVNSSNSNTFRAFSCSEQEQYILYSVKRILPTYTTKLYSDLTEYYKRSQHERTMEIFDHIRDLLIDNLLTRSFDQKTEIIWWMKESLLPADLLN